MDFARAARTEVPFGKHKGQTLDDVASIDEGLRYLDWMVGCDWLFGQFKAALETYLADSSIAKEVEAARLEAL